ncbi:DNA-binding transcriptional regulator, MerR family [Fictibacillus solisalsi]|uniref:DNA-binding transcriptional regulator, MerR family n=2 Tax=Fictibacillus solisalsi TaxID=459525 RepID=A0A1H0AQU2_9BACL|nr:DNA-binding transcriptional regulator, MerR family [Fictibacillus solisalsi]
MSELATLAGVSKRTIDYYTKLGLLKAERSQSNYRFYSGEALEQLKWINYYKNQHLPLEKIKEKMASLNEHSGEYAETLQKVDMQLNTLEKDVQELKPLLQQLNKDQLKLAVKHMPAERVALLHSLLLIIGETPFV